MCVQWSCFYYDPKSRASCLYKNDRLTSLKMTTPKSLFPRYQSSSPLNICSCCNSILKSNYVTCKALREKRRKVWQLRRTWSALRQLQLQMLTALFSFWEKKPWRSCSRECVVERATVIVLCVMQIVRLQVSFVHLFEGNFDFMQHKTSFVQSH